MTLSIFKLLIKWTAIVCVGLGLLVIIALHSISSYLRSGPDTVTALFDEHNYDYEVSIDTIQGRSIRSIRTGQINSAQTILFLHGAPGSWRDYSDYLVDPILQQTSMMIAIDRPGYGYSDYGHAEPSIIQQAKIAQQIIQLDAQDSVILVGHSYGGPVATAYAGLYPEQVSAILLLAPVIAPDHEKIFWFNRPLSWALIKALMPKYIQVANVEKLMHHAALADVTPLYESIKAPTIHMHCHDDWIAPYQPNVHWASEHITDFTIVAWEGDGHFLPNTKIDTILPQLLSLVGPDVKSAN